MKTKIDVFKFFKLCFVAATFILAPYVIGLRGQNKPTNVAASSKTGTAVKGVRQTAHDHHHQ